MSASAAPPIAPRRAPLRVVRRALLRQDFRYFLSQLQTSNGRTLEVPDHLKAWSRLMPEHQRLVLLAPRGHGKTTTVVAYILWQFYRHAHPVRTVGAPSAPGTFSVLLFSATQDQATAEHELARQFLVANEALFGDVGPRGTAAARKRGERWSAHGVRLASGAELRIRAYRTFSRGPHPDLLVLDDVESEANTGTKDQRDRSWRFFLDTLLPMRAGQILVLGTALHADDLLHRLAAPASADAGFTWVKYRALDEASGELLWPERHPLADLLALRDLDPLMFSREYQNEPIDDAASMFPRSLTDTLKVADATFLPRYRHGPEVAVILGLDIARSEAAGADFTVGMVVGYDRSTQKRRLLFARRERGLDFRQQLDWLREAMFLYQVDMAVVEENGFQKWLFQEAQRYPETAGKVIGHRTGQEKADLHEGVPALKLAFVDHLWELPAGDDASAKFFGWWQAEHAAFGWKDGKLQGVGEHDDTVMATWFVERGIRALQQWLRHAHDDEIVYGEDLGFERVHISPDLDALDAALGFESPAAARLRRLLEDE